jgi:hypothetical protein
MTVAAVTGPKPNSVVRLVPQARTEASSFFLAPQLPVDAAQVPDQRGGELQAGGLDRNRWRD